MKENKIRYTVLEENTFDLNQPSDNAQVMYTTLWLAARIGFDEAQQSLIASAVSELATNIVRYAGSGRITLSLVRNGTKEGIQILAKDRGPGIADIEQAMAESYSTGDSLGLGLPSVRRIMDEFDISSAPGLGTRILTRIWKRSH